MDDVDVSKMGTTLHGSATFQQTHHNSYFAQHIVVSDQDIVEVCFAWTSRAVSKK